MLDINELNGEVITSILSNKEWPDNDAGYAEIEQMSVWHAFDAYLTWHGIIGYTSQIMQALTNIQQAYASAKAQSPED